MLSLVVHTVPSSLFFYVYIAQNYIKYHILCASGLWSLINHQKITNFFWIVRVILPPHYAISLHFSIFQREFWVDSSLFKLLVQWMYQVKYLDAASKQGSEVSKRQPSVILVRIHWRCFKKRCQCVPAKVTVPIPVGIIKLNHQLKEYDLLLASLNMLLRLLPCCPASMRPASFFTMPFKCVSFGKAILEDSICNGVNTKLKFTTFETTLYKLPGLYDKIQLL